MNNAPTSTLQGRLLSLDALRGVAVFLMIEQHLGVWLWQGPTPGTSVMSYSALVGFNALGGGAAPLFVTLAGIGSALFAAQGRPRADRTQALRGIALMLFGLLLNLVTPSWFSWGSWFVLHMMGFAMALAPVWRRIPNWGLMVTAGGVLCATVVVQELLHTPYLTNDRMRDLSLAGGPLRLALAEGQFPILPWLAFYLAGFVAGRWIVAGRDWRILWLAGAALALGASFAAIYLLGLHPTLLKRAFRVYLGFYPASPAFVLLLIGVVLIAVFLGRVIDRRRPLRATNPVVTLGRASLTLLMLHVVLFREATRPIGWWHGFSPGPALAIIIGFVILSAILSRYWQRIGYRYGAEWLLRRVG